MPRRLPALAAMIAVGAWLTGCAVVKENTSCPDVPALRTEVIPKPPVSEQQQIWQPGQWVWNGASYTWRDGNWIKHTGQSGVWWPGHWVRDKVPGPCRWVPAYWQ